MPARLKKMELIYQSIRKRARQIASRTPLPKLYEARKYYQKNLGPRKPLEFPTWALNKFMKGLNEGIKAIEDATETPKDLRTIADYIEKG